MSQQPQDSQILNKHPQNVAELEEYIEVISEHQLNCERQGKYVEADLAKNKVRELKEELARKKKDEIRIRHLNEKQDVEKAHLEEFNQFNQFWDQKMLEFEQEAMRIENELIERQNAEFSSVQEDLEKAIPYKPKQSSEVLNLIKIEENLAKQKNYIEAHQVQLKKNQLEKTENQLWMNTRNEKIRKQLTLLKQRQQNELNALRQRINSGKEEQRKNRSIELERLLQKYQNVKKELEVQQQMENLQIEKQLKPKNQGNSNSKFNQTKSTRMH
ncbi:hypothetical protein ABPG72_001976 [Tetrahymena utriculariae]